MSFPDPTWLHAGGSAFLLAVMGIGGLASLPKSALGSRRLADKQWSRRAAVVRSATTFEDGSRSSSADSLASKGGQP